MSTIKRSKPDGMQPNGSTLLLPTVLLTLVFDFCAVVDLVPAGRVCRAWLQAPKNHRVWPRMSTQDFEVALRVLDPSKLQELGLDLGSLHLPSIRRLELNLSRCSELASLSIWNAEIETSRLLRAVSSLRLTTLHLDAGTEVTRFHYPSLNSSITHLSLVRMHLGRQALHVFRSLRVLRLEACVLSPTCVAFNVENLESLTAHDNTGTETLVTSGVNGCVLVDERVFWNMRDLNLSGSFGAEVLDANFAWWICECCPRLENLKLSSSGFADAVAAQALAIELKEKHHNLQKVELYSS